MMIRNIVALYITLLLLPVTLYCFRLVNEITFDYSEIADEIALFELREDLLYSYDFNVNSDEFRFRFKGSEHQLVFVNNKLLLQPGTQIILSNVDTLFFENENDVVYVYYEKENKKFRQALCSSIGIYLNEFSDCDDEYDEHSISEE